MDLSYVSAFNRFSGGFRCLLPSGRGGWFLQGKTKRETFQYKIQEIHDKCSHKSEGGENTHFISQREDGSIFPRYGKLLQISNSSVMLLFVLSRDEMVG